MSATIAELRSAREAKAALLSTGVQNAVTVEDNGGLVIGQKDLADMRTLYAEVKEIGDMIDMAEFHQQIKDGNGPAVGSLSVADAAEHYAHKAGYKSLGELFLASDEFKELRKSGGLTMRTPFMVEGVKDIARTGSSFFMEGKDVHTGSAPAQTTRGFGRTQFDPIVPRQQRPYRVRDLFPVTSTSANLIDYFRVLGFAQNNGDGNAQTVAERRAADEVSPPTGGTSDVFGLKPHSDLRFASEQAPVRTIAHWEAAHRNVLADEPQLQALINNELLYGLALEEDDQILNGDGSGENLLGVLRTPGIQAITQLAGDRRSDALRRSATLSFIANFPGTGFVMHPFDWEEIELQKADGDGQYMLVTNFAVGAETRIWRQPVVETTAMTQGTWLTGAFGLGAQLYDREQANVRIAEQHADFFVRNALVVLVEERLALAVKRPESFVKGTFV